MNLTTSNRKFLRQGWPVTVGVVVVFSLLVFYVYHHVNFFHDSSAVVHTNPVDLSTPEPHREPLDTSHIIAELYKPFVHPINSSQFSSNEGLTYHLKEHPRITQPLGKKVLILDVDTRAQNGEGEMLAKSLNYTVMTHGTAGMMNHYLYAMIHDYEYKFVRSPSYKDRHQTWVKVPMIREALKSYDFVVFLDSDAVFTNIHLPLEWLINYWGIGEETLVAMALDPNGPVNWDSKDYVLMNTGFVIAQSSPRTIEMFDIWEDCVSDTRYPGCAHWKEDWAHEQAAYGNYIRYDYERGVGKDIVEIDCSEANGYPEAADTGCIGQLVRHFWGNKKLTIDNMHHMFARYMAQRVHENFHGAIESTTVDATHRTLPLELQEGDRVIQ